MTQQTNPTLLSRALLAIGAAILLSTATTAHGQGCVAARGSGLPSMEHGGTSSKWEATVAYRWFKSDRHYVGSDYQEQRDAAGDQVINDSNFTDLSVTYTHSPRYSATLTLPYVSHDRSQVVKNAAGTILERYHTQASGLADISVVGNAWVFEPTHERKWNVQLGFGFGLPTGKKDVVDTFMVFDRPSGKITAARRSVDQSIQPGSGGYALIFSTNAYYDLGSGFTAYFNGSYNVTPQETNGVATFRSNVYESIMSIADTYVWRIGAEYALGNGFAASLGLREEGVPVNDLIGGSTGFRRPGYSLAIDPGISYSAEKWSVRLYVPFAIRRNREQSIPDKQTSVATGTFRQGDAAFADYLIMSTVSYKF